MPQPAQRRLSHIPPPGIRRLIHTDTGPDEPPAGRMPRMPLTSSCLAGSWRFPWVELQSPVGALAECLLECRAGGEPQHLGCLGGELPVGVGCQVQAAGDTTPREPVIPGGGELAGARLNPLVMPHARGR